MSRSRGSFSSGQFSGRIASLRIQFSHSLFPEFRVIISLDSPPSVGNNIGNDFQCYMLLCLCPEKKNVSFVPTLQVFLNCSIWIGLSYKLTSDSIILVRKVNYDNQISHQGSTLGCLGKWMLTPTQFGCCQRGRVRKQWLCWQIRNVHKNIKISLINEEVNVSRNQAT